MLLGKLEQSSEDEKKAVVEAIKAAQAADDAWSAIPLRCLEKVRGCILTHCFLVAVFCRMLEFKECSLVLRVFFVTRAVQCRLVPCNAILNDSIVLWKLT